MVAVCFEFFLKFVFLFFYVAFLGFIFLPFQVASLHWHFAFLHLYCQWSAMESNLSRRIGYAILDSAVHMK